MMRSALAVGSLCAAMAMQGPARGVVVDASGRPLAGVTIWSWWDDPVVTGVDGGFPLPKAGKYRILADGYAPRIVTNAAFAAPVVLRAATAPRRNLARCPADVDGTGGLHIPTPAGVDASQRGHEDYVSTTWSRGGATLRHAHGPTYTDGLPVESVLSDLADVDDRDVRLVLDADDPLGFPVTDVRGRLANGRRYRYVGIFGEMFEYGGLTAEDAAFFDRMLDAMCYMVRQPPK